MHVQEIRLQQVLEGTKQYKVPLYQRTYSWTPKQLERLWSDVIALTDARSVEGQATHFTGSLVLSTGGIGPGGAEFLVVDGQQRLTTLSVLIAAMRDHIAKHEPDAPQKPARLHETYLADRFKQGDERLKVLPTQADRASFRAIIDRSIENEPRSGILDAYKFFRAKLVETDDPDDAHDIDRIASAVLDGLVFVSITANHGDNVYRIFESLNNTGMKLTQGDLLRNYIFMRLGHRGEEIYTSVWLPMQNLLSATDLEALFWMDITWSNPEAKQGDVYSLQEDRLSRLSDDEVETEVRRYARLARLLSRIRRPIVDKHLELGIGLHRISEWRNTSADPLILKVLDLHDSGQIDDVEAAKTIGILESFFVRRLLVNAPSGALSRILLRASGELDEADVAFSLHTYLSTGRKFFATDRQIAEAIASKPFYFSGKPNQRKTFLAWLERLVAGKEPASLEGATIEHIMPQTLTVEWRDALSVDLGEFASAEDLHEAYLHTLANLTLSAYNSELSNSPFAIKRVLLAESNIALNVPIAAEDQWGRQEILGRSATLARLITSRWVSPLADAAAVESAMSWKIAAEVVESIPLARWASYGDVAAVAGTHPVPLGFFLGRTTVVGAWRVLQAAGTISAGFRWIPGSAQDGQDPAAVLTGEGLIFDSSGRADPDQRIGIIELAALAGRQLQPDNVVSDEEDFDEDDTTPWAFSDAEPGAQAEAVSFTLAGIARELSRELVASSLRDKRPGVILKYWVEVEEVRWPVKQALATALNVSPREFQSWLARKQFSALGFLVGSEY